MPTHGRVASRANAISPPTAGLGLCPATCKVIDHVVDIWTNRGEVDFSLKVARNAPPSGRVAHSYTWGARVELQAGDWWRRSSYRGLLGWRGAQLSVRGDRGRPVLYDLIFFLRSGGLKWRSSNRVLPGLAGWGLGLRDTRWSRNWRGFRQARRPWRGRNGRWGHRARRQRRFDALGLLMGPS